MCLVVVCLPLLFPQKYPPFFPVSILLPAWFSAGFRWFLSSILATATWTKISTSTTFKSPLFVLLIFYRIPSFLNRSIDPCDDFYGHVCGIDQIEAQPTILMMVNMKKFLKPYLTDLYNQTQEIVEVVDENWSYNLFSTEIKEQKCHVWIGGRKEGRD